MCVFASANSLVETYDCLRRHLVIAYSVVVMQRLITRDKKFRHYSLQEWPKPFYGHYLFF